MTNDEMLFLLLVASGSGKRYGPATRPKLLENIAGRSVLIHSLCAFLPLAALRHIVLIHPPNERDLYARHLEEYIWNETPLSPERKKLQAKHLTLHYTEGGEQRFHSVYHGLQTLERYGLRSGQVLIHDAARPLIHHADLSNLLTKAQNGHAHQLGVIPGIPLRDTVKTVTSTNEAANENEIILDHPRRQNLRAVSTPQIFPLRPLLSSYEAFMTEIRTRSKNHKAPLLQEPTDDSEIYMLTGHSVAVIPLAHPNPKLTYAQDLEEIETLIKKG